ncbi:MAG: lysylphosphatidylglycerol synthase transmembrane domain-containing protein [Saprospiraceae bacterium]
MQNLLRNFLQFLFFLSIGCVILFLVYRSQNEAYKNECCIQNIPQWETTDSQAEKDALLKECREAGTAETACVPLLDKLISDFGKVKYGWIALVLLAFVVSNISRTYKWKMLLQPMGFNPRPINCFLSILVSYFANLGLPRLGEVVRAGVLSKYEKLPVEKVMGTIVVDRVVDMLCLVLAFGLALLFESEKILGFLAENKTEEVEEVAGFPWKMVVLLAFILGGVLLFSFRKRLAGSVVFKKVVGILQGFWEGIKTVRQLENPWLFVFHSLSIWVLFFVMTWLGFKAFGPTEHLDLRAALLVFVFGTLGMVIPSPGGMGTFHFLVITALTLFYGIKGDDAFSIANIIFFCVQIGFNSLLGILALVLLPIINRQPKPI